VTVNLAVALAAAGHDVGILDADVYGFSVPGMLGVTEEPTVHDLKMLPPEAHGVRCISMGFFLEDEQPVVWRGPMLHKALEQFLVDVDWGDPEFLLVDMPPGTGDVALSMAQYLPTSEMYVVTTPQPAARKVAQRSAYMAKKLNLPMRGVIENMSWWTMPDGSRQTLFGEGGGAQLAGELGVPLLAQIPLDPALREGGDQGRPIAAEAPESEVGRAFHALADAIVKKGRSRVFRPELTVR
jgi:ATP-binding protein involved in chromosome partitioning